jgi:hypothetical protein
MKRSLILLVWLAVLLIGCTGTSPVVRRTPVGENAIPAATALPTRDPNIIPDMKIDTVMMGENPRDPGGIPLLLSLQPNVDAPNTNVTITMPSDVVVLTGSETWAGDLKADQGLYLNLMLQIDVLSKPGEIKIESISYPKDGPKLVKVYKLYVRPVANGKLEFSKTPFNP